MKRVLSFLVILISVLTVFGQGVNIPDSTDGTTPLYHYNSKVGLGLTNPATSFDIGTGSLYIRSWETDPTVGKGLRLGFNGGESHIHSYDYFNSEWKNLYLKSLALQLNARSAIQMYSNDVEELRVAPGYVYVPNSLSIGATNNTYPLFIDAGSDNVNPVKITGSSPIATGILLENTNSTSYGWQTRITNLGTFQIRDFQVSQGYIPFQIQMNAPNNSFLIESTGDIGIGKSNPAYKLDVAGTINASEFLIDGQPFSWIPQVGKTEFISLYDHSTRTNNFGLNLESTGSSPTYYIENNKAGVNRQAFYFGQANTKNIFGISSSTDSGTNWLARFVINQTGNVGVGTNTPNYILDVAGTVNATEYLLNGQPLSAGSTSSVFDTLNNNAYYTNGNVGIGTTNPQNAFTIQASHNDAQFKIIRSESPAQGFELKAGGGQVVYTSVEGTNTVYGRHIWNSTKGTETVERMRISDNGNVGIGTDAPQSILHIKGTSGTANLILQSTTTGGYGNGIEMRTSDDNIISRIEYNTLTELALGIGTSSSISFLTGGYTAANERMVIDETGNVGIGNTSPAYKLDVAGTVNATEYLLNGQPLSAGSSSSVFDTLNNNAYYTNGNVGIGTTNPHATMTIIKEDNPHTYHSIVNNSYNSTTLSTFNNLEGWQGNFLAFQRGRGTYFNPLPVNSGDVIAINDYWGYSNGMQRTASMSVIVDGEPVNDIIPSRFQFNTTSADGGGTRMVIKHDGKIGIGTTNPQELLQVYNAIGPSRIRIQSSNTIGRIDATASDIFRIETTTPDALQLRTNDNTAVHIDINQNVGIGTINPLSNFHVEGNTRFSSTSSKYVEFTADAGINYLTSHGNSLMFSTLREEDHIRFKTNDLNRMMILGTGNVGIGTTSPAHKLDVAGTINATEYLLNGEPLSAGSSSVWGTTAGNAHYEGGNVGIGTTNPGDHNLYVNGNIYIPENRPTTVGWNGIQLGSGYNSLNLQGDYNVHGDVMIGHNAYGIDPEDYKWRSTTANFGSRLIKFSYSTGITFFADNQVTTNDASFTPTPRMVIKNDGNIGIGTENPLSNFHVEGSTRFSFNNNEYLEFTVDAANNYLTSHGNSFMLSTLRETDHIRFKTNDLNRMVILGTGNVGIGTTNPEAKLHLNEGIIKISDSTDGIVYLSPIALNAYPGSSVSGFEVKSHKTLHLHAKETGYPIVFSTADTERMRVADNGNVGIGTTAPAYNLDVAGTINATEILVDGQPLSAGSSSVWGTTNGNAHFEGGKVGIGTTTPESPLHIQWSSISSLKLAAEQNPGSYNVNLMASFSDENTLRLQMSNQDIITASRAPRKTSIYTFNSSGTSDERITIDGTNGNVGIGTNAPSEKLHINSDGNTYAKVESSVATSIGIKLKNPVNEWFLWNTGTGNFNIGPNGSAKLSVENSGNVGIGITDPNAKLHVLNGDIRIDDTENSARMLHLYRNSELIGELSTRNTAITLRAQNDRNIRIEDNEGNGIFVQDGGNVAIGTTSPLAKLHVKASSSGQTTINSGADDFVLESSTSAGLSLLSGNTSAGNIAFGDAEHNQKGLIQYHHSTDYMRFFTNSVERFRIDNDGRVGIGTTTPAYNLDVAGTINATEILVDGIPLSSAGSSVWDTINGNAYFQSGSVHIGTDESNSALDLRGSVFVTTNNDAVMTFENSDNSWQYMQFKKNGSRKAWIGLDPTSDFYIWKENGGDIVFQGANVGIGTTTPGGALTVEKNAARNTEFFRPNALDQDETNIFIGKSAILNQSAVIGYTYNSNSDEQNINFGFHSNENKLVINGKGNVGIGSTNPQFSLHINSSTDDGIAIESGNAILGKDVSSGNYTQLLFWNGESAYYGRSNLGGNIDNHIFRTQGTDRLIINNEGNVAIGTSDPGEYKLAVNGKIKTREVNVTITEWPDYVFADDYKLKSLNEVKSFVDQNKHLPGVPSEKVVKEEGIDLGEMNKILLQKVEELTLYMIQQNEKIEKLEKEVEELKQ